MVAEFLLHCVNPKYIEIPNDSQPIMLHNDIIEQNHTKSIPPNLIRLISSREKLEFRAVKGIYCYHEPNPDKDTEKHAHHSLFNFIHFAMKKL